MSVAGWIVLGLLAAALVGVTVAWRRTRSVLAAVTGELDTEQAAHQETRRGAEHLETRMRTLRAELAEAHRTNADLTAKVGRANPADAARALGLWALERHRQARMAGTPLLGLAVGPGIDLTATLTDAIRVELEVLREDVGTHAELATVELGGGIDARDALTVLRIVQELSAVLAKRADELVVSVAREDDITVVTISAEGWTDPTPTVTALESGLGALEGTLELRPDPETADTLLATVRIGNADET
ncbi:MAG: hypothetical protein ABJC79_04480 [Acidimicrobiia bacterium]